MITISSAEFQRHFGRYQDEALTQPVAITRNGRERVVILSVNEPAAESAGAGGPAGRCPEQRGA
jgi:prevent-host-death family protein